MFDSSDEEEQRAEFYATAVRAMDCLPGNFEHADGDEAVVLTVGKGMDIEQMAFPIEDAKMIVVKMLVALATYDDAFAKKLLDDNFPADDDGDFEYPVAYLEDDEDGTDL